MMLPTTFLIKFQAILVALCLQQQYASSSHYGGGRKAVCYLRRDPNSSQHVKGTVTFTQAEPWSYVKVQVDIVGLKVLSPGSAATEFRHGFHVHEYGVQDGTCGSTGGHFNPRGVNHGSPQNNRNRRHVGDFGNLVQTKDGTIRTEFTDRLASLYGGYAIIGRAIVIHELEDDLRRGGDAGSLATGNAGSRLACCTIGYSKP